MGFIPEETLEQIRQRADIHDVVSQFVPLRKRGSDFWGCCPFHHEKTPSFKVNVERGAYYCFGCKEHGTVFDFVKAMLNTDFPGAAHWLAERYGIQIPEQQVPGLPPEEAARRRQDKERRMALLQAAAAWYHQCLQLPEAQIARNYLDSRGLDEPSIRQFCLGYSPDNLGKFLQWASAGGYTEEDLLATGMVIRREETGQIHLRFYNRLMFPIWDENGKVRGFSARQLIANPHQGKYVNSPETDFFLKGQLLYAMNFARAKLKDFGHALICEGQLDVISCHRAGLTCAVAAEGTAFTEQHARLLAKSVKKIILCFDADSAGYKASQRTIGLLHAQGLEVGVVTLPEGEDPDSLFRKGGAEALKRQMSLPEPAIPYLFRVTSQQVDTNTPEGKSQLVRRVLAAIQPIPDDITKIAHCQWLAQELKLPERVILDTLAALENTRSDTASPVGKTPLPYPQRAQRPQQPPLAIRCQQEAAPNQKLWMTLLDLVLHFEEFVPQLEQELATLAILPDSPVGQAISQVMVAYDQEEWNGAMDQIQNDPRLFQDADVARTLLDSEYSMEKTAASAPPDGATTSSPLEKRAAIAFRDCLKCLNMLALSQAIAQKQQEMAGELSPERQHELQEEITALIHRKQQLKKKTPQQSGAQPQ